MKFPAANILIKDWNPHEDYLMYILMDEYIHTGSDKIYNNYFKDMLYVDSNGDIFKLTEKRLPTSIWRNLFRFLPNVYKVELRFKKMPDKMDIESVRDFILKQISNLPKADYVEERKNQIKSAKSISEVLGDK